MPVDDEIIKNGGFLGALDRAGNKISNYSQGQKEKARPGRNPIGRPRTRK